MIYDYNAVLRTSDIIRSHVVFTQLLYLYNLLYSVVSITLAMIKSTDVGQPIAETQIIQTGKH